MNSYFVLLALLEALLVIGAICANSDKWLTPKQVRANANPPLKPDEGFISYRGHGAILGMAAFGIPAATFIFHNYSGQWSTITVIAAGLASLLLCIHLVRDWVKDPVRNAFVRNGQPTVPMLLKFVAMLIVFTAAVLYFTATGVSDPWSRWVAIAFVLNLALALLQPPALVHDRIHGVAWALFLGVTALICVGLLKLSYYPGLHFAF